MKIFTKTLLVIHWKDEVGPILSTKTSIEALEKYSAPQFFTFF